MILRTPSVISNRRIPRTSVASWLLFAILLTLLITTPALAQDNTWLPIGPAGDQVCESAAVAVVPGAAGKLYTAGLGCGVFYSEDGGDTWTPRNQGLPASGVTALAVAPSQPDRLYAGTDHTIYRSDDGGLTWRRQEGFPVSYNLDDVNRIVVHPTDPDILYAIRGEYSFFGGRALLIRSLDGGESWTRMETGSINDVAYDPDLPRRMYAASYGAVLRSDDDWETWEELPLNYQIIQPIKRIYVASSSHIYAVLASGSGIYGSSDGGDSWAAFNEGLSDTFIDALTSGPADPLGLYAAAHGGDIFHYDKDAERWALLADQEHTPFSAVNWLAVDNGALLAAAPEGLFQSQDGAQWRLLSQKVQDPRVNIHHLTVTAGSQGQLWIAAGQDGIFSRSTQVEEGVSWVTHNNGLEDQRILSLAVDPQNQAILYAGTETNLFKSEDGGQSWRESDQGLEPPPLPTPSQAASEPTGLAVTALAVDPRDSNRVYAGTSQSLFISADGGESWTVNTDFANVPNWPIYPTIVQIAIAPSDPAVLYAVTRLGEQNGYIFKSVNRGENWTLPAIGGSAIPAPGQVVIAPQDAETLYGISMDSAYGGGIWGSQDGGHTWRLIGPTPVGFAGAHIAITEGDNPVIAAAGVQGYEYGEPRTSVVYLSWDGGAHWLPVNSGLENVTFTGLAFDPNRPTRLYAGVAGKGVMEADFARQRLFLPAIFAKE